MLTKKDRELLNEKQKVKNRDVLIANMEEQAKILHEENKDLRFENEEQSILINKIKKLTEQNTYDNETVILRKIKELVCDYQSIN